MLLYQWLRNGGQFDGSRCLRFVVVKMPVYVQIKFYSLSLQWLTHNQYFCGNSSRRSCKTGTDCDGISFVACIEWALFS